MTNRVIHQKYLEAWLRGESVDTTYSLSEDWNVFTLDTHDLSCFSNKSWSFRITPKTIEVNLKDFYAEYDKITVMEISYERGYDKLVTLIKKYLPRY